MTTLRVLVFCALVTSSWGSEGLVFPPGFKFGAGSSAYQVEGAWNVSDKGLSTWDYMIHLPEFTNDDGTNGDVACDSYHQWRRDIEIAAELGLKHYRFSISWPRLLPDGFANRISEAGKNYHNNLIDGLLERGIEPIVTIYHFDLPQSLQDLGGWASPLIVDWFGDFARIAYSLFADRVTTWITINEPLSICDMAYNAAMFIPKIANNQSGYVCNKNIMLAHAKAWRIYDEEFKPKYNGKVSICNHWVWYESALEGDEDIAELVLDFIHGRFSHPIYSKEGGWAPHIEKIVNEYASELGYLRPWLPAFTQEEIEFVRGTYDYYAFNMYTSRIARTAVPGEEINTLLYFYGIPELNVVLETRPEWVQTFASMFSLHAEGLRKHLSWAREKYGDIEFFIMENGLATEGSMNDDERIDFIYDHLEQVWLAIHEDGVNVAGYIYWSIMDSFEWYDSISKFGLYHVDFESPERTRTPRKSADFYKKIAETNTLSKPCHRDLHNAFSKYCSFDSVLQHG